MLWNYEFNLDNAVRDLPALLDNAREGRNEVAFMR